MSRTERIRWLAHRGPADNRGNIIQSNSREGGTNGPGPRSQPYPRVVEQTSADVTRGTEALSKAGAGQFQHPNKDKADLKDTKPKGFTP